MLPGPTSSQVGFALGMAKAGLPGALTAWTAFTLPSAALMLLLALVAGTPGGLIADAVVHGLKLVAVVIVAHAVWGMARTLAPDLRRTMIAAVAALVVFWVGGAFGQIGAIILGASLGALVCRYLPMTTVLSVPLVVSRRTGAVCLGLFGLLLVGLPLIAETLDWPALRLFDIFYRAGALVFGGGHVVLPLLRAELVPLGLVGDDRFLAAYGFAQGLPGPLFTIAAYLGAVGGNGLGGGLLALAAVFLPGLLVLVGVLPFWSLVRANTVLLAAIAGVNAAVVGILALALYDPLWTTTVGSWRDVALIAVALAGLLRWKLPPLAIVVSLVVASLIITAS